ncbi:MAG: hypothetical protein IPG57_03140 [Burkholderiales bacterium]|nr:hypothetical protein [Burkholderiales bacterium]
MLDPSPAPTQLISQEVQAVAVPSQLEALETFSLALHRNDLTRGSDTAESLLQRLGVNDPEAARFLREDVLARQILTGRVGKRVQVRSESAPGGGQLLEMIVRGPAAGGDDAALHFTRTTLRRTAEGSLPPASRWHCSTSRCWAPGASKAACLPPRTRRCCRTR